MRVGVYDAKSKLSQMIEKALAGERVIISRNGEDVVELRPIRKKTRKNWIGMYEGQIVIHDDFDDPIEEFEDYS